MAEYWNHLGGWFRTFCSTRRNRSGPAQSKPETFCEDDDLEVTLEILKLSEPDMVDLWSDPTPEVRARMKEFARIIKDASSTHHLETDASLNLKKTKTGDDGRPLWLAGGGIVVRSPEMKPLGWDSIPLGYVRSAEHAEGLALLEGMRQAREKFGATELRARSDNYVLVQHVNREYKMSEGSIQDTVARIWSEAENFSRFKLLWSASSHVWFRSDLTPTADTLARSAAGLELRGVKGTSQRIFRTLPR